MRKQPVMSPLARARLAAGLTQQDAADRWRDAWPDDSRGTAKNVSNWETGTRQPSLETLRRLAEVYRCRIADLVDDTAPEPLAVALAVVVRGFDVLLVHNRDSGRWQFPAGTVKPGRDPARTAARECLAETGVHTEPTRNLGSRVHPRSRALCHYLACDYLAGDQVNADPDENLAVAWAPIRDLDRFIPLDDVYSPVLDHLGARPCLTPTG